MGRRGKLVALFFIGFASTCSLGIAILIRNLGSDFAAMERNEALKVENAGRNQTYALGASESACLLAPAQE